MATLQNGGSDCKRTVGDEEISQSEVHKMKNRRQY